MFFNLSDITIHSNYEVQKLVLKVSQALQIVPLELDKSGKYDGDIVYSSVCFGLSFELAKDDNLINSYHLSVNSDIDTFDFDGSETEIDGTQYILLLLNSAGIKASPRDPHLLYD